MYVDTAKEEIINKTFSIEEFPTVSLLSLLVLSLGWIVVEVEAVYGFFCSFSPDKNKKYPSLHYFLNMVYTIKIYGSNLFEN